MNLTRLSGAAALVALLALAGAADLPPRQPSPSFNGVHDVLAFGAVGDGVTDDAPAIKAAFQAACATHGGKVRLSPLRLDGTPAVYAWLSPVDIACDVASSVPIIFLEGPAIVLMTAVPGMPYDGLSVTGINQLSIRGIKFYGSLDFANSRTPMPPLRSVVHAVRARIEECEFNGFNIYQEPGHSTFDGDNAVVFAPSLELHTVTFGANGGTQRPVVMLRDWYEGRFTDVTFVDHYTLNNIPMAPVGDTPVGGIVAIRPDSWAGSAGLSTSGLYLDNVRVDEGIGYYGGLYVWRGVGGPTVPWVRVRGYLTNLVPANGSTSIYLDGVDTVDIDGLFVREGGASGSRALVIANTRAATVRATRTDPKAQVSACSIAAGTVRISDSHLNRAGITTPRLIDGDQ